MFFIANSATVRTQNGLPYFSNMTGEFEYEVEGKEKEILLTLPSKGFFEIGFSAGAGSYDVHVPSGAYDNKINGSGWTLAAEMTTNIVPETIVNPRIAAKASYGLKRAKLGKLALGANGTAYNVENRLDIWKTAFSIWIEKSCKNRKLKPSIGFELSRKGSTLTDLTDGEETSGRVDEASVFAGLKWVISDYEYISFTGHVLDEEGFSLSFSHNF
ncbi:hypothetical protein ACFL6Y_08400 [Elusimicrobiota bacterium]